MSQLTKLRRVKHEDKEKRIIFLHSDTDLMCKAYQVCYNPRFAEIQATWIGIQSSANHLIECMRRIQNIYHIKSVKYNDRNICKIAI